MDGNILESPRCQNKVLLSTFNRVEVLLPGKQSENRMTTDGAWNRYPELDGPNQGPRKSEFQRPLTSSGHLCLRHMSRAVHMKENEVKGGARLAKSRILDLRLKQGTYNALF